jgi:hypothetical protein
MGLAKRIRGGAAWPATVVLVCAAIEIWALADRSRGEPRNEDVRRYVLGEIFDAHRVEQRFLVKADGLSMVRIHPRPASPSPTGTVVLELRDISRGHDDVVQRAATPLASLARSESFVMRFPPQRSRYREYSLAVSVEGASDGQGIGLLAARGEGYRGATLFVDGRPRFGDLLFETSVDNATTNFGSIASQLAQGGIPVSRVVLVLLLIAEFGALYFVIRAFGRPADASIP